MPHLARLDQSGYVNAWMGQNKMSWIQAGHANAYLTQVKPEGETLSVTVVRVW